MEQPSPERTRASANEVFRDHGIAAVFLLAWEIWCIRDGWYNPGYEHITFSRGMAYISAPFLVFSSVMAISSGLTLLKAKKQPAPPPPPSEPPPAG